MTEIIGIIAVCQNSDVTGAFILHIQTWLDYAPLVSNFLNVTLH